MERRAEQESMKHFELSLTMTSEQCQRRQDIFRNAGTMRRRRLAIGYFVDVEQDHRGSSGNSVWSAVRGDMGYGGPCSGSKISCEVHQHDSRHCQMQDGIDGIYFIWQDRSRTIDILNGRCVPRTAIVREAPRASRLSRFLRRRRQKALFCASRMRVKVLKVKGDMFC